MLVAENVVLKEKVSSLETEILSLLSKRVQENILLELVGRRLNSNMVAAAVLTHPPQTPYDIIIIDAGSEDSVTLGSEVSLPEGPILGAVLEVFPKRARVKLFSASGEETNAILERNDVPIVLEGTGGGSFKFILPRDIRVEKGDRIISRSVSSKSDKYLRHSICICNAMIHRTLGIMIVLVSILVLPYWIYLPVLFIAMALISFFWEGILFAFLIDAIYGNGITTAVVALIILIILLPLRDRLRMYV